MELTKKEYMDLNSQGRFNKMQVKLIRMVQTIKAKGEQQDSMWSKIRNEHNFQNKMEMNEEH